MFDRRYFETYQSPDWVLWASLASNTLYLFNLSVQSFHTTQLRDAYPVGTHLNNIRLAIFVFAEWFMPSPTADSIAVLENHEIMNGSIREGLL